MFNHNKSSSSVFLAWPRLCLQLHGKPLRTLSSLIHSSAAQRRARGTQRLVQEQTPSYQRICGLRTRLIQPQDFFMDQEIPLAPYWRPGDIVIDSKPSHGGARDPEPEAGQPGKEGSFRRGVKDLRRTSGGPQEDLRRNSGGPQEELRRTSGGTQEDFRRTSGGPQGGLRRTSGGTQEDLRRTSGGLQEELRRTSGGPQEDLRRTSGGPQ